MKTSRHTLVCAALFTALAGTAMAQAPAAAPATTLGPQAQGHAQGHAHGAGPDATHGHRMKDGEHGPQRMERRLGELKSQLQLTPEQEGAWNQFTQAMRPAGPMQRPDREAMMKLPTPERLDQMRAMRAQHQAQMDKRIEATKTFYASLTPEQKKRFDERGARMMDRHGPSRHQGHHGHHG